ncbi:MAG: hypothetical protein ACON37_06400 [Candidatus Puniceispirillaceae bacterium]
MWLSRLIIAASLFWLAGCGTMEVATLGTALQKRDVAINVVDTGGRNGQLYSRQLRKRLADQQLAATHDLTTVLNVSSSTTLSVRGSSSDLKKMTMSATITLVDRSTGDIVLSDTLSANATLGTVSSYFSQVRSDRHGNERLAMLLADRVANRIHLYFTVPAS